MNQHPVTMTNLLNLTHTTAITSTTNRARCRSGSHSSTDGGSRKPVSRSIGRKLLMRGDLQGRRNNLSSYRRLPRRVKSDRLLGSMAASEVKQYPSWSLRGEGSSPL